MKASCGLSFRLALSVLGVALARASAELLPGTLGSFPKPPDTPVCNVTALGTPRCIAECQGQEKCCFYGCRWQCLTPVKEKWQPCPTFNTSMCPLAPPETSECHDDNQCPGTQRCCCHGNCTLQCTETVREKPGFCPVPKEACGSTETHQCRNDTDCPRKQKCCESCGQKCWEPVPENKRFCPLQHRRPPSCAAPPPPECHGDRDCRRNEKCCFFSCGFQCVKALEEKPGVCPTTKDLCPSPSDEKLCSRDRQCPGLQKCCPECGHRCVDLKQEQMLFCPYVNVTLIKCNASSAKSQCSNDSDCSANKKCCNTGCRMKCVAVVEGRSGVCKEDRPSQNVCRDKCNFDMDCPERHKCCTGKRGQECQPA